jgi:phosphodiesterase/alkaline phosphatase D-like protein
MKRKRLFLMSGLVIAACVILHSAADAQVSPTLKKADHVQITQGPELERNDSYLTIITWTSNNPGGSPEHYGVVHYGKSPDSLTATSKSPIRLNPTHDYTVFRVRMDELAPRTTYYYTVDSIESDGTSDGVKSSVKHFTTP